MKVYGISLHRHRRENRERGCCGAGAYGHRGEQPVVDFVHRFLRRIVGRSGIFAWLFVSFFLTKMRLVRKAHLGNARIFLAVVNAREEFLFEIYRHACRLGDSR